MSAFVPTPSDVQVIVSYNAMGGSGFSSAFLRHPASKYWYLGAVMSWPFPKKNGRDSCGLSPMRYKWSRRAEAGAGDGRRRYMTCPTDYCYDLGPEDINGQLTKFQLSAYTIRNPDYPDVILHYKDGEQTQVSEIPAALITLKSTVEHLTRTLLPAWDYTKPKKVIRKDVKAMMRAVSELATV
ncbi:hypothetical protein B0H10DRAFT_2206147 [Mycena sp. CBHHK59/15]|nr:hypothetical protein B0H10DRAFT_2206147 [Mycena sp. CBHHK59/15]